jgi:probable HAF family extracellular repeat protein
MDAARLMRISPLKVVLVSVVVALLLGAQPVLGQPVATQQLSITDLGKLPGSDDSRASDINDRGQVVGSSNTAWNKSRAFLWERGKMRDLGSLPGAYVALATGINNRGQVVGYNFVDSGVGAFAHALLWERGKMRDLGALPRRGDDSTAGDINDRGQVVGYSNTFVREPSGDAQFEPHAFLWQKGKMRDLGTLPGGNFSNATGINDRGQVVGHSCWFGYDKCRAVLWSKVMWSK